MRVLPTSTTTSGFMGPPRTGGLAQGRHHGAHQLGQALARHRRDGQHRPAQLALQAARGLVAAGQLGLAHGHDLRLGRQAWRVQLQLAADGPVVLQRVAAVGGQRLDQVDQDAGPLDVAQELVAQADAAVGALDQAGQVGQDEGPLAADGDQAEVGVLGGERIVGDLRLGLRQPAEQGGLAGVGQADQAGVGDDLQFQDDPAFLAGGAGLGLARGAVGGGGEGLVAAAAAAAAGHDDLLAGRGQVAQDVAAVAVEDEGARRHGDDQVARPCGRGSCRGRRGRRRRPASACG